MTNAHTNGNGILADLKLKLWIAADKLRGHTDAAKYKHVVLGLFFLEYISDAFQEKYDQLTQEPYTDPEDRDEYAADSKHGVLHFTTCTELEAQHLLSLTVDSYVYAS